MYIVIPLLLISALLFLKTCESYKENHLSTSITCAGFCTIITSITAVLLLDICIYKIPSNEEIHKAQIEELHSSIIRQIEFIEKEKADKDFNGIIEEYGKLNEDIYIYNTKVRAAKIKRDSLIFHDFEYKFWDEFEVIEVK